MRNKTVKMALALSLLVLLCVSAGCGNRGAAGTRTDFAGYSADGSVILEKDGVTVTTAGLGSDPTATEETPIIWVDIENTGARDVWLGVSGGSVNGVAADVRLIDFYQEDGTYYGANYETQLAIPAGGSGRYALGYFGTGVPGIDLSTLGELEFCFTMAEDAYSRYSYLSEPVAIVAGTEASAPDITALGTVVMDDDRITLVVGEQDYDDFFGPEVYVYLRNKSGRFIGVSPETAELDGVFCDYLYGGLAAAPGKVAAASISFDGEARELKGFESMTVCFRLYEAETIDGIDPDNGTALAPVTVRYPPQNWGEYENGGMSMEIRPRYNELVTVEAPADDGNGVLFSVSETASLAAGGYDGAGWLFSIGKISEARLHEMLCYDLSGVDIFAKDGEGNYYAYYHPTDVRYERATAEEMERDMGQWSMLCEWAEGMKDRFVERNGLESVSYGGSDVELYLARAAYLDGVNYTLSTTEYGPVDGRGVDGAPYAEFVMRGCFEAVDIGETPDGEYVVLSFPEEAVRLDFFFAPGAYVRVTSGDGETLYQAMWYDDDTSFAEAMRNWYYAAAELAGVRPPDESPVP